MEKHIEEFQKSQQSKFNSCYIQKGEDADANDETQEPDEFKHHRLMAGYHSLKADELKAEALELNSATDPSLHKESKTRTAEANRHTTALEEHREAAKRLYDEEKHGGWSETVPTKSEALRYGSKKAKEMDATKPSEDDVKKSVEDKGSLAMSAGTPNTDENGSYFYTSQSGKNYNIQESLPNTAKDDLTRDDHNKLAEIHSKVKSEIGKDNSLYIHHLSSEMTHKALAQDDDLNNEIIGKLNSGKVVRENPQHSDHLSFTADEHKEAAGLYGANKNASNAHNFAASIKGSSINKSFEILGVDMNKAEGSRGGKVIGHTKRGEAIYEHAGHEAHKYFGPDEHKQAAALHNHLHMKMGRSSKESDKNAEYDKIAKHHLSQASAHKKLAKEKTTGLG